MGSPGELDEDDVIPEDALEFNPAAADVNQVFIEPPPNPEWTAATGTFKALVFKNEQPEADAEIELDADFLSSTAEMRKLKLGLAEGDSGTHPQLDENNMGTPPASGAAAEPTQQRAPPAPQSPPNRSPATSLSASATHAASAPRTSPPETQSQPVPAADSLASRSVGRPMGQPQLHAFLSETQSQPRLRPSAPETRGEGRKTIRAYGLDSVDSSPSQLRLASLARSRIAPSPLELEPPSHLVRLRELLSSSPTLWTAGVAALAILLLAQIVNHYRNDLAATSQFNKPITALYSALGVKLTPHWDLHAYDVRQLGASVDAESAGQIMVRASVKNGGHQAQPMPLLRVTLQDRFGNRIAARDVAPGSYLPRAIPAASFLSAGQRIDAEMSFVDPGANAVGFEIDACLPAPAGGIACANDPVSR
jgi:hypothetical protein